MKETPLRILQAARELLVKQGYAGMSLGAIADHLGISKGVVTYHFPQKDLILQQLVQSFFHDASAYMAQHMVLDRSAPEALASYLESNLRFVAGHRMQTLATTQIMANHRNKDGTLAFAEDEQIYEPLIEIFQYGQDEEKSFRSFPPKLMAIFVRSIIDRVSGQIAMGQVEDVNGAIQETINTFRLATRRETHESDSE
ncbi:AcrR family transcriptional regulator [Paenibacillus phyllosphaerae]|uniref:AcrR family transcriptional regulator n=1 Tax=Paenibacillus phyllosphaerae TaxID=274593 RepID=A0A7W5B432_9BACL|nr:TetR/AcrR family transcriptional regulator [Paenibacillus phyllosphaerae]MBB3113799.1 AcrR family transcriptional regulator [Paenibacillus phyllosphaerae]